MYKKQSIVVLTAGIFLVITFSVSCYTTFKHPQIYSYTDSTQVYHAQEIAFSDDCSSCHENNTAINNPYPQVYEYPVYEDNYNWQYYYVTPWWVDQYYYEDHQSEQNEKLPPTQKRDFDRREISPSPAVAAPNTSGYSLSRPSTTDSTPSAPAQQPEPPKRSERRQDLTNKSSKSGQSSTPAPVRKERDKKESKKENE